MRTFALWFMTIFVTGALFAQEERHDLPENHASVEFNLNDILVHHLMDAPLLEIPPIAGKKIRPGDPAYAEGGIRRYVFRDDQGVYKWETPWYIPQLHITKRVAMMWLVAIALLLVFIPGARIVSRDVSRVQGRFAGIVEVLVSYVRSDMAESNMHHPSQIFVAYAITSFFFILFSNLMGLVPPLGEIAEITRSYLLMGHPPAHHAMQGEMPSRFIMLWPGITVTGDVAVTMTFGVMTTVLIWVAGFKHQGVNFVWQAVPGGVPLWLFPIMWPIEFIIGPLAKGFALTIRLLANMTAGHVIILVFAGFIFQYKSFLLVPVSVLGMGAIYLLEVGVAFLQAFIFTLLSSIFIGMSMHRH